MPGLVCIVGVGAAAPGICCACAWPTEVVLLKKTVSFMYTFTSFGWEKKKSVNIQISRAALKIQVK